MKTCIWCLNTCEKYRNEIAPACAGMFGQEAEVYRIQWASECDNYLTNNDDNLKMIDSIHDISEIEIKPISALNAISCSVDAYAQNNPSCKKLVAGIVTCSECGKPMCPVCHRHNVTQLSRVTGYVGDVAGWNEGKKQELQDRKRHNLR